MHAKSVVHRDLKPQNILIDRSRAGMPKICDFGLSRVHNSMQAKTTLVAGTAAYLAPEVVTTSQAEVASSWDVYAFGVTLWWMLHQCDPYPDLGEPQIFNAVAAHGLRPTIAKGCPAPIVDLIQQCWCQDPLMRLDMVEIQGILAPLVDIVQYGEISLPLDIVQQ